MTKRTKTQEPKEVNLDKGFRYKICLEGEATSNSMLGLDAALGYCAMAMASGKAKVAAVLDYETGEIHKPTDEAVEKAKNLVQPQQAVAGKVEQPKAEGEVPEWVTEETGGLAEVSNSKAKRTRKPRKLEQPEVKTETIAEVVTKEEVKAKKTTKKAKAKKATTEGRSSVTVEGVALVGDGEQKKVKIVVAGKKRTLKSYYVVIVDAPGSIEFAYELHRANGDIIQPLDRPFVTGYELVAEGLKKDVVAEADFTDELK